MNEFEELTQIYNLISSTINENDRNSLNEKYALLKDKFNRLLDVLTQRITLLDEAIRKFNTTRKTSVF